jgi:hypothetical protein
LAGRDCRDAGAGAGAGGARMSAEGARVASISRRRAEIAGVAVAAVSLMAAAANRAGPPPAMTGGFGEPTCHSCHFDNPEERGPDTAERALLLLGLPERYEPGQAYVLSIELRHPDLRRAGFELAARFATGDAAARDAGLLSSMGSRTATTRFGTPAISYIHHTDGGTRVEEPGSARWEFEWRAPESSLAPVVFHFTGNAANDDDSELGDRIFVRSVTVPPAPEKD